MNRKVLQLLIDHQAKQQAAGAEEQSPRQQVMSVHAEEIHEMHGPQIRQNQVGFASARRFLRAGECGKQQQAQEGRHCSKRTLKEGLGAVLDGSGGKARKEKGHNERKRADGQKETHPILCSHNSSKRDVDG